MINPNPETVSTDYDTSDRLYLEPLDARAGARRCAEQPLGVLVSFGGQTPLKLAPALARRAFLCWVALGAIDPAEDRGRFERPTRRARPSRAAVDARRDDAAEAQAAADELRLSRCWYGRTT